MLICVIQANGQNVQIHHINQILLDIMELSMDQIIHHKIGIKISKIHPDNLISIIQRNYLNQVYLEAVSLDNALATIRSKIR